MAADTLKAQTARLAESGGLGRSRTMVSASWLWLCRCIRVTRVPIPAANAGKD